MDEESKKDNLLKIYLIQIEDEDGDDFDQKLFLVKPKRKRDQRTTTTTTAAATPRQTDCSQKNTIRVFRGAML